MPAPFTPTSRPAVLSAVPTPTLAATGGPLGDGQALPYVAVPLAALLGFIAWVVRRRMGGGDQGGAS
jgi:hypothetical protein